MSDQDRRKQQTTFSSENTASIAFHVSQHVARELDRLAAPRGVSKEVVAREILLASLAGPSLTDVMAQLRTNQDLVNAQRQQLDAQLHRLQHGLVCAVSCFLSNALGISIESAINWATHHMFPRPPSVDAPESLPRPRSALPEEGPNPLAEYIEAPAIQSTSRDQDANELTVNFDRAEDMTQDPAATRDQQIRILVEVLKTAGHLEVPFSELAELAKQRFAESQN